MPNTHNTLASLFGDIANAIRAKTGGSAQIVADNFPTVIASIPTGSQIHSGIITASRWTYDDTNDCWIATVINIPITVSEFFMVCVQPRIAKNDNEWYMYSLWHRSSSINDVYDIYIDSSTTSEYAVNYSGASGQSIADFVQNGSTLTITLHDEIPIMGRYSFIAW